jgi:hypothetical protein
MNLGETKHRFQDVIDACLQDAGSSPDAIPRALVAVDRERKRAQHEIDDYTTRRLPVNQRTGLVQKLDRMYDAVAAVRSAEQ